MSPTESPSQNSKITIHSPSSSNKDLKKRKIAMEKMSELLGRTLQRVNAKDKKPPHQLSATVDLIQAAGLFTKKYGYTYWLGKVHSAGVDYNEMIGILKSVQGMDAKYNKGGRLTNILSERGKTKKTTNEKAKG